LPLGEWLPVHRIEPGTGYGHCKAKKYGGPLWQGQQRANFGEYIPCRAAFRSKRPFADKPVFRGSASAVRHENMFNLR